MRNGRSFLGAWGVRALIAFPVFPLIFLLVFSLESAWAEPLVSIFYTGDSLGLYKACPT